jgi:predicted nucleic acid-binding protein
VLFLDTSALVRRYVAEPGSELVIELMTQDPRWAAAALAQVETRVTLCHLGLDEAAEAEAGRRVSDDWERFLVVRLAEPLLETAAEIACELRLRTLDAIHLAAALQLPRPVTFLTFDRQQSAAAISLGLEVASVDHAG